MGNYFGGYTEPSKSGRLRDDGTFPPNLTQKEIARLAVIARCGLWPFRAPLNPTAKNRRDFLDKFLLYDTLYLQLGRSILPPASATMRGQREVPQNLRATGLGQLRMPRNSF